MTDGQIGICPSWNRTFRTGTGSLLLLVSPCTLVSSLPSPNDSTCWPCLIYQPYNESKHHPTLPYPTLPIPLHALPMPKVARLLNQSISPHKPTIHSILRRLLHSSAASSRSCRNPVLTYVSRILCSSNDHDAFLLQIPPPCFFPMLIVEGWLLWRRGRRRSRPELLLRCC